VSRKASPGEVSPKALAGDELVSRKALAAGFGRENQIFTGGYKVADARAVRYFSDRAARAAPLTKTLDSVALG
jgi:hypothetical protein